MTPELWGQPRALTSIVSDDVRITTTPSGNLLLTYWDGSSPVAGGPYSTSRLLGQFADMTGALQGAPVVLASGVVNARFGGPIFPSVLTERQFEMAMLPASAALPNGGFVAAYVKYDAVNAVAATWFRMFDAAGTPIGEDRRVLPADSRNDYAPTIAVFDDGRFVIGLTDQYTGEDRDVKAVLYAAAGTQLSSRVYEVSTTISANNLVLLADSFRSTLLAVWEQKSIPSGYVDIVGATDAVTTGFTNENSFTIAVAYANERWPVLARLANDTYAVVYNTDNALATRTIGYANGGALPTSTAVTLTGFAQTTSARNLDLVRATDTEYVAAYTTNPYVLSVQNLTPLSGGTAIGLSAHNGLADQSSVDLARLPDGRVAAVWIDFETGDPILQIIDIRGPSFFGSDGPDTIYGANGSSANFANTIDALGGNDLVFGLSGEDTLLGGAGNDTLAGGDGADRLSGGAGNDTLFGEAGSDVLDGGADNDFLSGSIGDDQLFGGDGNDAVYGEAGADDVQGGAGTDTLVGGGSDDVVSGGADNDQLYGEAGNDILNGDSGTDFLAGGVGDDQLDGGADNDSLFGEGGFDQLVGGDANDYLDGGVQDDVLNGGAGNDLLLGNLGADQLTGGTGADYFAFGAANHGGDTILDFSVAEADKIYIFAAGFGGGLVAGALAANRFVSGANPVANQAFGQFLFDTGQGRLLWDPDGSGAGGAATITTVFVAGGSLASLTAADFLLF